MFANACVTRFCLALSLAFAPGTALAGSFKVAPIKLFFDAKTKSAVVHVSNRDQEKSTLQLEALEWTQDGQGADQYAPTQDIVFFPKIMTLEKGEEKIVRVGYQVGPQKKEKTYRLYLEELPVSEPGEIAVKTVLRLGVPIFIDPIEPHRKSVIDKVEVQAGAIGVTVKNIGNQHVLVSRIKATALSGAEAETFSKEVGGWYVLPGAAKTFYVDIPRDACEKSNTIKVAIKVEQQADMAAESSVNRSQCDDKAQDEKQPAKLRTGSSPNKGPGNT